MVYWLLTRNGFRVAYSFTYSLDPDRGLLLDPSGLVISRLQDDISLRYHFYSFFLGDHHT